MAKKEKKNPKANRNILAVTYGVAALFLVLAVYFGYFLFAKREQVINNTYNSRLDRFSEQIIRGRLLASDGETVLADTQTDENGKETRVYAYGDVFGHVLGYISKGKTGLEAGANYYLLTSHVNLAEQIVNELGGQKTPGDDVVTTLDTELQQAAFTGAGYRKDFGHGFKAGL